MTDSRTLTRIWTTFVIAMLLASLIPALANPVLAAPDVDEPAAAAEQDGQPVDSDGDGLTDDDEVNVHGTNPQAADSDGDGIGDGQEVQSGTNPLSQDSDGDGIPDGQDLNPLVPDVVDSDQDGIGDNVDNCTNVPNPDQADSNGNGIGDACDETQAPDSDGDLVPDDVDNCPDVQNPNQEDSDGNGTGDACQMQPQLVTNGTIQSRLLICPPGTDASTANEGSCNLYDPASPGTFGLQPAGVQINTGGDGYAIFTEVVPGQVTLSLDSPDLPLVESTAQWLNPACTTDSNEAGQSNTKPYTRASGSAIAFEMLPGETVNCLWYVVGEGQGFDIYNRKYICPPDLDFTQVQTWTLQDWRDACQEPVTGVTFTVNATNYAETQETDPNNQNTAVFEDVPFGQFSITEQMPEGYYFLFKVCIVVQNGDPLGQPEMSFDPEYSGEQQQANVEVRCEWFNIVPYAHIVIYKLNCPEDFDYAAATTPQDFAPCNLPVDPPVEFTVTIQGPQPPYEQTESTDPNGNNTAIFRNLPAGQVTIEELIPEGYEVVRRFCGYAPQSNAQQSTQDLARMDGETRIREIRESSERVPQLMEYPVADGPVTFDLVPGYIWGCIFVNMPVHDYEVTVYKWKCDPETLPNQPLEYYTGDGGDPGPCETSHEPGVPFTLTDANGDTPFLSEDHQGVTLPFEPDANGTFTITEGELDGYVEPFRYCLPLNEPENGNAMPPEWQLGGTGKSITVNVLEGEYQYQCWFYNIPAPEYTVTVYKYICDPGTAYNNPDPAYYGEQCATQEAGVPFTLSDGNGDTPFQSDNNGQQLEGVVLDANGSFTITEGEFEGYADPVRYCLPLNEPENGMAQPWQTLAQSRTITVTPIEGEYTYQCWFYNIPWEDSTVTIRKWECPEGAMPDGTPEWYQTNCTTQHNGVDFTLTDSNGPRMLTTAGGQVQWTDVQEGFVSIAESIPPGYDPSPYVVCGWTAMHNGAVLDAFPQPVNTINGVWNTTITYPGTDVFCDWYNQYLGDGEITVYKYECPEGYDPYAWGANPMVDCTTALNGITFVLDQPDPEVDLQSDTGDSVNGAVYFGGLAPGDYTISEMVPPDYEMVFVWECVGINTSSVHPKPLSVGPNLAFPIAGGDSIECYWYNVPMPDDGWMLVKKYNCTTATYVSDVNCYTNTTGQAFDLQMWNGSNWMTVQSGTTNASGQVSFMNLDAGDYRLVEPGKTACLMKSSNITSGGNIGVVENQQTTVYVYNCSSTPPSPKTPTKYPNTGVGPAADGGDLRTSHGASLLGMLGLAGTAAVSRRTFLKRAAVGTLAVGGGTVALNRAIASQTLVPLDATVTPAGSPAGTPAVDCLYPATPSATPEGVLPGTPVACARGAAPVQIRIESIGVDYPIEYLEIIEGEMEQPTGAEFIAYYKETARLGERGNGLYAGHLNWWNMPEGPFFLLETLVEGDVVELEGDDGEVYRYIVQWTQDFPIDEEPPEEALGQTEDEVITLITCGGEWDAEVALYDHRTVVRAIRDRDFVPGTPAPGA